MTFEEIKLAIEKGEPVFVDGGVFDSTISFIPVLLRVLDGNWAVGGGVGILFNLDRVSATKSDAQKKYLNQLIEHKMETIRDAEAVIEECEARLLEENKQGGK
jgi:hypothetical protein